MEKVNGAWICSSVFRSRNHNDGVSLFPSSSSIFLFPLLLLFLLLPSLASPRGSRSIFLSLFLSVSRILSFFTPRFTHVYIYIHAYKGRGVRYAKSLNTAVKCRRRVCQYGERGCHALFSPVPLRCTNRRAKSRY